MLYSVIFVQLKRLQTEGQELKSTVGMKRVSPHLAVELICYQAVPEPSSLHAGVSF